MTPSSLHLYKDYFEYIESFLSFPSFGQLGVGDEKGNYCLFFTARPVGAFFRLEGHLFVLKLKSEGARGSGVGAPEKFFEPWAFFLTTPFCEC